MNNSNTQQEDQQAVVRNTKDFLQELDLLGASIKEVKYESAEAEWYIRGIIYHAKNLINSYNDIIAGVVKRINDVGVVDVLIMYTPSSQTMMFEFYALVNLLRISLDALRKLLAPVFITPIKQIPKSITDFRKGTTNCPLYNKLMESQSISYLIDLRNCIVHYRGFTVNDNTIAVKEAKDQEEIDSDNDYDNFTKASFRVVDYKLVFNVYLPDIIFSCDQTCKKLAEFTYNNRLNILSESMNFIRIVIGSYLEALSYLGESMTPRFEYGRYGLNI